MASVNDSTVTIRPGIPVFVELLARRAVSPSLAKSGTLHTEIEADLGRDEPNKAIKAVVHIKISGIPKDSADAAFTIECKMECDYFFKTLPSEERAADSSFVAKLCDPIYQRAAVGAQGLSLQLGFGRINLPLTLPDDLKIATVEKSKSPPAVGIKSKKATKTKAKA